MKSEEFYNYVMDNFNISGEAARLIDNILSYVEENFPDKNEQYIQLCALLDGTIGLSDSEIKQVCM